MSKAPNDFETRQEQVRREIATPPFPKDVTHYDDGSWECSAGSFDLMAKSFKRYGFVLDYRWSFDSLRARFSFIIRASSLISGLDSGWVEERHTPELVAYLRAVAARDDLLVSKALPAALRQDEQRRTATDAPSSSQAKRAAESEHQSDPGNRPRLYLVQP